VRTTDTLQEVLSCWYVLLHCDIETPLDSIIVIRLPFALPQDFTCSPADVVVSDPQLLQLRQTRQGVAQVTELVVCN